MVCTSHQTWCSVQVQTWFMRFTNWTMDSLAETLTLVFDKEDWRGHGQLGGMYVSALEVLFKEVIQLLLFDWGQEVDFSAECLSFGDKFNGMVPFLPIQELVKGFFSKDALEFLVGIRHYVLECVKQASPATSASFWDIV